MKVSEDCVKGGSGISSELVRQSKMHVGAWATWSKTLMLLSTIVALYAECIDIWRQTRLLEIASSGKENKSIPFPQSAER